MPDDELRPGAVARPAVVFFCGLAAVLLTGLTVPGPRVLGFPWILAGLPVAGVGLGLGIAHRRALTRHRQSGIYWDVPSRLVADGPYRVSRNPLYLGMVLMTLGLALLFGKAVPLVVVAACFLSMNAWVIPPEEAVLRKAFGPDYEAYRTRVRRWI